LDNLLKKDDLTLDEILDEENIMNEVKSSGEKIGK